MEKFNNYLATPRLPPSTGLQYQSGKDGRLIILHVSSEDGFVEDRLLIFVFKKPGNYHQEKTAIGFEE